MGVLLSTLRGSARRDIAADPQGVWPDVEARFYARGLAQSNYAQQVGGALQRLVGPCRSLVDVGAGCGMLGAMLVQGGERWTAIEPSRYMRGRIRQRGKALAGLDTNAIAARWEEVDPAALKPHDVALGANIGGPMQHPLALLAFMRRVATRRIACSVSAQHGPRTFCLSGLLPPEIHGLDTRPGHLYTLEALGKANQPDSIDFVDWHFAYAFVSHAAARAHFVDRMRRPDLDRDGSPLDDFLRGALIRRGGDFIACAPKRSAILIWNQDKAGDHR